MATGTVSSVTGDVWQLIASNTPTTSPTQIDFTSIAGYKTIMVVFKGINTGASASISFTCNNDTTTGDYAGGNNIGTETSIRVISNTTGVRGGIAIIYDVDKSVPHTAWVAGQVSADRSTAQAYLEPAPITSIEARAGGQTFTAGTIYLYGIAS
jgi:hypothetical protein